MTVTPVTLDDLAACLNSAVSERDGLRADAAAAEARATEAEALAAAQAITLVELRSRIAELETPADPAVLPGWGAPVWRDEFDQGLGRWNVRDRFLTFDTARAMAGNVTVADGALHLRGDWLAAAEAAGKQGLLTHTTGYIDTRNLKDSANPTPKAFSQRYGRWEIRCKTPTGPNTRGSLAAFWLRCDSHPGEIDVMEAWGYGGTMAADHTRYLKDTAATTFHSSTNSASVNGKPYVKTLWRHREYGGPALVWDGFHTYALEYMPDYCALFVDDVQLFRVTPTSPDPMNSGQTLAWLWDRDFFGSPLHMRINLHVGPSLAYWGLPDPTNRALTGPLDFAVEYVRVYAP